MRWSCGQVSRQRLSPDAALRIQAKKTSLGMLFAAVSANPDDAKTRFAATVLYFDDGERVYQDGVPSRRAPRSLTSQVNASLLEGIAKCVSAANFHSQPRGVTGFRAVKQESPRP